MASGQSSNTALCGIPALLPSSVERAMAVEIRGEIVFRDAALAAGIMANGQRGTATGLRWRRNPNDNSGVVQRRRCPDVIHRDLRYAGDRRPGVNQNRDAVRETCKTASARTACVDVQLMRDPMSATCSSNRLPVVIGDVPDEALFRLDMPIDASTRSSYSIPASSAIEPAKERRD